MLAWYAYFLQHLCFRYIDSTIPLLHVLGLVEDPEDRFSHNEAHLNSAVCEPGSELTDSGCSACPRGSYKDDNVDRFGSCIACTSPFDYTEIEGASSSEACIIRKLPFMDSNMS